MSSNLYKVRGRRKTAQALAETLVQGDHGDPRNSILSSSLCRALRPIVLTEDTVLHYDCIASVALHRLHDETKRRYSLCYQARRRPAANPRRLSMLCQNLGFQISTTELE